MITAEIKFNFKAPKFTHQKDLMHIAKKIFIPWMQEGIEQGIAVDGSPFPPLEPDTVKRKRGEVSKRVFGKRGNIRASAIKTISSTGLSSFSAKTLIQTGKLKTSFFAAEKGKDSVRISLNSDRKEIGKFLQIEGVGKIHKKFNFFGINPLMERQALDYLRQRTAEVINAA